MTTLVFDGHPNPDSLVSALAHRYASNYPDAELVAVRDVRGNFAPELRRRIEAATHLVIVAPTWWASVPAQLKYVIDEVFIAGWAYRYRPLPWGLRGGLPQGLLRGRSARVILTSDTPVILLPFSGDHAARTLAREILPFCGIKPVRVTKFGGVRWSTLEQRLAWLKRVEQLAKKDAARNARH